MPILNVHHLSESDAVLYVLAVILQPRDLEEQAGLFARLQNSNTSFAMRRRLRPAQWRRNQAALQLTGIDKRDSDRTTGANVAAIMLRLALRGISLNRACKEIHDRFGIGTSTCWRYWDQFRPAAHLNAARLFWPKLGHPEPPELTLVLRAAEELRWRGEARVMPRSGRLLDASEMWKVSEELLLLL